MEDTDAPYDIEQLTMTGTDRVLVVKPPDSVEMTSLNFDDNHYKQVHRIINVEHYFKMDTMM